MHKIVSVTMLQFLSVVPTLSGSFNFNGSVKNNTGSIISSARISLTGTEFFTYSNKTGEFNLKGETGGIIHSPHIPNEREFSFRNGILNIQNLHEGEKTLEVFQANGRLITRRIVEGTSGVQLPLRSIAPATGFVFIVIGSGTFRQIYSLLLQVNICCKPVKSQNATTISKQHQANELEVSAPGYYSLNNLLETTTASGLVFTLTQQNLDTVNCFQRFYTGNGQVVDLASGQVTVIPEKRRIHLLLFPEGYTQDELGKGKFDADCNSWYQSVFAFDPMLFFRECFVIWKYPVVSNEHINSDGSADTRFKLKLSGGSVTSKLDTAAKQVWTLIENFSYPPEDYYTEKGFINGIAKNVIAQLLVYDTSLDRAGFSGIATTLRNPKNPLQWLGVSLAQDQQHEFMHSLAHLADEYYETDHRPCDSSTIKESSGCLTNVVYTDSCSRLPWRHLIKNGEYNPGVDSLVGSFGANGRYHSELYCLMNGIHDNTSLFGGNGQLRVYNRLCNFCREIVSFRIYERIGILDDQTTSYDRWITAYRASFYQEFPFFKPSVVPQLNSANEPQWMMCR